MAAQCLGSSPDEGWELSYVEVLQLARSSFYQDIGMDSSFSK